MLTISDLPNLKYLLENIQLTLDQRGIKFSKSAAARIVGGERRLEQLIAKGNIRMERPSSKQNGKWFCSGGDVIRNMKFN